jgi:BASS family bile acid:Na+ symporter
MNILRKICLGISGTAALLVLVGLITAHTNIWQPAAVAMCFSGAIGLGAIPSVKNYQYTAWIITAVVAAMIYPASFLKAGDLDLRNKWLILIVVQTVMFGMGIQMSIRDFTGLGSTGKGVLIGLACHFSVMPLMGLLLTKVFNFEPEIAAGIILIGSCSSGLASNVMVYLAKANLVLSVTVTAMATLAAPLLTPLLMKLLAGTLIEIKFINMLMEIIKIVLVPVGAALLHDYLKRASKPQRNVVYVIAVLCVVYLLALPFGLHEVIAANFAEAAQQSAEVFAFMLGAFLVGTLYHQLYRAQPKVDVYIPYLSMFGIVYFTAVTTAAGRDNLLHVGFLLFIASAWIRGWQVHWVNWLR